MDGIWPSKWKSGRLPTAADFCTARARTGRSRWQKQKKHGAYFALHDLTHLTVESVCGFRDGFYGLISQGWDIEDTSGKRSRGALPPGAIEVEFIVGVLDTERACGYLFSNQEFNETAATNATNSGRPAPRQLAEEELIAIRKVRGQLFAQWREIPEGGTLKAAFPYAARG